MQQPVSLPRSRVDRCRTKPDNWHMLDQALRSLQDVLAIKGIRRVLWFFLVLTMFVICFEAQTNFFEINAISNRIEVLEKVSQQPLSAEQAARIEKMKDGLLDELERVQAKRANPFSQFGRLLLRFIKGAWITLPLFWLVIKVAWFFLKRSKTEDFQVKGLMVYFGWLGLSAVAWITTLLGVNSVMWNSSQNILISWIVFPVCSALAFIVIVVWIILLRSLMPRDAKQQTATSQQMAPPAGD